MPFPPVVDTLLGVLGALQPSPQGDSHTKPVIQPTGDNLLTFMAFPLVPHVIHSRLNCGHLGRHVVHVVSNHMVLSLQRSNTLQSVFIYIDQSLSKNSTLLYKTLTGLDIKVNCGGECPF